MERSSLFIRIGAAEFIRGIYIVWLGCSILRAAGFTNTKIYKLTLFILLLQMKAICGLEKAPLFSPIVADYYSGMLVSVPLFGEFLHGIDTPEQLHALFCDHYAGQKFVRVMPFGAEGSGMLSGNRRSGWDGMEIFVSGNPERMVLSASFDNLGKGASGAAIQCLNLMMGCEEEKGLNL